MEVIRMYIFEAHYINVLEDTNRKEVIEFDGQFFESEKECYLYAMAIAYDKMDQKSEMFDRLDFIAC